MKRCPLAGLLPVTTALLFTSAAATATVNLQFGNSSIRASNWANSDDAAGEQLLWGVIVDRDNNGFATTYHPAGIDYSITGAGQSLRNANAAVTDDLLFLSPALMSLALTTVDSGQVGQNGISSIIIPYGNGVNFTDSFLVVWFDPTQGGAPTAAGAPAPGDRYGIFSNAIFTIPNDGGTEPYTSIFAGADPLKQMTLTFVPEPATGLLGLLGAVGLLRRRRRL